VTDEKLYPEEPDDRQGARVKLQARIRTLDELWEKRGTMAVSDEELQAAIEAVNEAGQEYAATF
jgi:hypothetical protein